MDKVTYIIWKNQEDRNVADVNDVIGLFHGTYLEADALINRLNAADPSVQHPSGPFNRIRYGYWRSEPVWITPANEREFTEGL